MVIKSYYFLITALRKNQIDLFLAILKQKYDVCNLLFPSTYLKWTINRLRNGTIHIGQPMLIKKILDKQKIAQANHRTVPLSNSPAFDENAQSKPLTKPETESYGSLMDCLRYVADGKSLDIAFVTSRLELHINLSTKTHWMDWKITRHILRYVNHTAEHGIIYTEDGNKELQTSYDADFTNVRDGRSITETIHAAFRDPCQEYLKSRTPQNTCDAEYLYASQALQETV